MDVPQPSIHGCCTSRYDLGDEDSRVVWDVWIINSTSNTEAKTRVSLYDAGHGLISTSDYLNKLF